MRDVWNPSACNASSTARTSATADGRDAPSAFAYSALPISKARISATRTGCRPLPWAASRSVRCPDPIRISRIAIPAPALRTGLITGHSK